MTSLVLVLHIVPGVLPCIDKFRLLYTASLIMNTFIRQMAVKQTICKIMSACISAAVLMKLFHEVMYCYVSKFVTVKLLPNLLIISA